MRTYFSIFPASRLRPIGPIIDDWLEPEVPAISRRTANVRFAVDATCQTNCWADEQSIGNAPDLAKLAKFSQFMAIAAWIRCLFRR